MELLKFVKRKKIRPVIDSVFPLKEAREAAGADGEWV